MRRLVVVVALVASVVVLGPPGAEAAPTFVRRAGADRYATAVEVSKASAPLGADDLFIASGTSSADALTASSLRSPVLLVPPTSLPADVAAEIDRLQPDLIRVVGGSAVVSDAVLEQLRSHTTGEVRRIAGPDRYATAAALSAATYTNEDMVIIASGENQPDALSAGAVGLPILLVPRNGVPQAVRDELARLPVKHLIVVGGTAAISDATAQQLAQYGEVQRESGKDRYATSVAVSKFSHDGPKDDVYLASGRTVADALAGGWAAGNANSPVLLTERTCVPDVVRAELDRLAPQRLVLLGGTASLTDDVGHLRACGATETAVIATGLDVPWDVAFVGTDAYLTQRRSGKLLKRSADGTITTVQTLPSVDFGEGGLLGLTERDGLLYAYLTTSTDNRIVRFRPGEAPTPILTGIARNANHDAGRIAFGPDGMLYAATGDAGDGARSQDPVSLNGKVLRMTPDGKVPADNPRPGSYVYALGFRDPQGLAWDAAGRLYATEFGPDRDDEVNRVVPDGNYGWPIVTGQAHDARFVDPIVVRQTAVASWSGATIVRGGVPEWDGDLLVAALRGTRLYRFDLDAAGNVIGTGQELYTGTYGRLRQVKQAPDGSLWLLTSNRDGRGAPVAADDRIIRIGPPA
jgi:glucose/arabinose dehydrogenase